MADEKQLKQAQATYNSLCEMLRALDWHFTKEDSEFSIECSARGEDLSMRIRIEVDADRQLIILYSPMPFDVPENKRTAMAVAVALANYGLVDGSFDYNFLNGRILFRMTSSFLDSIIDKELLEYMLIVSCKTIDDYNDKFLVVTQKEMSLQDIMNYIK